LFTLAERRDPVGRGRHGSRGLRRQDAGQVLAGPRPGDDLGLQGVEDALYGELDQIGVERGLRQLTGPPALIATDIVKKDIAKLKARQEDQEAARVFDGMLLGLPEVEEDVLELPPDRYRVIVDLLMDPVIMPVGKGGYVFDEDHQQALDRLDLLGA
jgi:hypothetical protein